ncbi:asparagine synthase (glutamine-hydrolyzing) [Candidatus Saccharibacteria bacterium]|nr:asparagine synthase (glutamine-hydrolyzing) [Candidatus Saccharibacteria bacterium]
MCGIAGYYGLNDVTLLDAMNQLQEHRGPDGDGTYTDGPVGLAHRRLAIIDRSLGQQPMILKDGSLATVYNGEIYNYKDLRKKLEAAGRVFVTNSDTEIILHGYREWGDTLWDKLNGMFAIALYDKTDQSLRLVRDHFGIKPIYYSQPDSGQIIFASEIKPLLATGKVARVPNDRSIYRYLMFRIQDDGSETFFRDISRVCSGEMIIVKDGKITKKKYTSLEADLVKPRKTAAYDANSIEQFSKAFSNSILLRLQSEVPVGTSLSGGLDSSAVAAVIAEQLANNQTKDERLASVGKKQNTFSAIFPSSINDEEKYVDAFLGQYGDTITSHKIQPKSDQFVEDLSDFIRTQEEPIVSTGPYAQYQVMREASKHVTVLLDGQGADEMMAGYIPYYFVYLRELRAAGKWGTLLKEVVLSLDVLLRLARFTIMDRLSFRTRVLNKDVIGNEFAEHHKDEAFSVVRDNLKRRLVQDIFHHSIPSLLRYEDKNTMRFSIEGRVPFLDKDLLTQLFSLDNKAIIKDGVNKRVLRDAMKNRLPEMIRARRNKVGFTTPEYEWAMSLKKEFYTLFNSESFYARPYFNGPAVLAAFEGFIHKRNDATSMMFWRMMNLELWLREFIDTEVPDESNRKKKSLFVPNSHKKLDITTTQGKYRRFAVQTERVSDETNLENFITSTLEGAFKELAGYTHKNDIANKKWYLYISEKIVATTQGRSYFIWDIDAGFWANLLSRFVRKTPAGIGLGSPWTMEIAIREAGLPRILFATVASAFGKIIGKRGVFYNLVGSSVRAIDGPTQYSVFPANVSAKLPPLEPHKVAKMLDEIVRTCAPAAYKDSFGGVVVIDANDIGRNILGSTVDAPESEQEAIFGDNPLGQGREQTPVAMVFKVQ